MEGLFGVAVARGKVGARSCVLHAAIGLLGLGLEEAEPLQELGGRYRLLDQRDLSLGLSFTLLGPGEAPK